jgi:exodeoxyribonuclease V alpha subunit
MQNRGNKHTCTDCGAIYYDLCRKPVCPKCHPVRPQTSPDPEKELATSKEGKTSRSGHKDASGSGNDGGICVAGRIQKNTNHAGYSLVTFSGSRRLITNQVPPEWNGQYILMSGDLKGSGTGKTVTWGSAIKLPRFPINGLKKFLSSRHFSDVGIRTASDLAKVHGESIFSVLFQGEDALKERAQISDEIAKTICAKWKELSSARDLHVCLRDAEGDGLGDHFSDRIVQEFGSGVVQILDGNPRKITEKISGFGLKRLIDLCQALGTLTRFDAEMELRLEHILVRFERVDGHTCAPFRRVQGGLLKEGAIEGLINTSGHENSKVLEWVESESFGKNFLRMTVNDEECVARRDTYSMEQNLAKEMKRISDAQPDSALSIDSDVKNFSDPLGNEIQLDQDQARAVGAALRQTITLVTGGPGSGKTTLVKALLDQLRRSGIPNSDICLMAPTGLAAKRLAVSTDEEASTIHSKLKIYAGKEAGDSNETLAAKVIIVDECSMLTMDLCLHIVTSVEDGARLILIGDFNQLPPIGLGQPYRDLIESGKFPVERLTGNHRQGAESDIAVASKAVLEGNMPRHRNTDGFEFIEEVEEGKIQEQVISLYNQYTRRAGDNSRDNTLAQILTPMKINDLGKEALNALVQEKIGTARGTKITDSKEALYINDRAIFTENNRDLGLVNGDIGTVLEVSSETGKGFVATVSFDVGKKKLDEKNLRKLEPAYALTIHKGQGSEFDTVIMPISDSQSFMLRKNLLYTAITRGKRKVVLVGDLEAFRKGIQSNRGVFRYTGLSEILIRE